MNRELVWKLYPSGFPVTSATHVVEDEAQTTLCGIWIDPEFQWYFEEWIETNLECKRCKKIIRSKK